MKIASKFNRKIKMKQRINKIKGKFYPLKHEEWLEACRKLKPSERDVLYFIRTLDPRNNGVLISTAKIARALSTPKRKVHRRTVSRALKRLDQLGFLDLEIVAAQVRLRGGGLWSDDGAACGSHNRPNPEVDQTIQGVDQTIQGVDHLIHPADHLIHLADQMIHPEIAKILTEKGIQRNGDFTDLIDLIDLLDLSEGEGESFREFCQRETAHFDPPLRSLDDYLASRDASGRPRYWPLWQKYQSANRDWRSHPHYQEWATAIERDGYGWVVQQFGQPEYSELIEFYEWYERRNSSL
jgi:DNA-binding MarR family transcriptional regulator